jgi:hypothetical protein
MNQEGFVLEYRYGLILETVSGMIHLEMSVQILQVSVDTVVVYIKRRCLPLAVPKRSYGNLERR